MHPYEILVDDEESKYNCPRQMFQHKEVSRRKLIKMFPKYATLIEGASNRRWEDAENPGSQGISDSVSVIEAWHLPSAPDADDGRHVIAISNCTLIDEPWERDDFPFTSVYWEEPVIGFWGTGIIEEIIEKQHEINYLESKAQQEMNLGACRIIMPPGNDIAKVKIDNQIGTIIEAANPQAVQVVNANMVAQETWMQIDRETQKCYEVTGISQLSAQSQKPTGLNSGKAIREFSDIESERFQHIVQMYEESIIDASCKMIELAKEVSERNDESEYKILADDGDGSLKEISWKDVEIERDKYILKVYPTNFLPSTPSGQWQQVEEMLQAGFIGREEGMALLDYPDLKAVSNRLNAAYKIIEQDIYMILVEAEPMVPESYYNLELAARMSQTAYLQARIDKYPEERLEMLRRYIDRINELMNPPPPPAPPGMAPPGPGMEGPPPEGMPPEMMEGPPGPPM